MNATIESELSSRRRHGVLAICCLSLFLVSLDSNIVNIALPAMSADFHAQIADLQWIIDAYVLVLASLLIFGGSLGDRYGRRPVFMTGMALFGAGSLFCSFAVSPAQLVAARIFQAIGGSMLNPLAMSIIANTFSDARERARAIGVWGAVNGLGAAAGPLLGGVLVSTVGWRAIFWINVPVVLVGLVLTHQFVPNSKAPIPRRFDPPGQVLMLVFMACAIGSIIEGPRLGWSAAGTLAMMGVALASFVAWIACEWRSSEPLINLHFFRNHEFSAAVGAAILAFASLGGFMFASTLYLQDERGLSPLAAGVAMLPVALMAMVLPPVSSHMVTRRGPGLPLMVSGVAFVAAAAAIFFLPAQAPLAGFIIAYFLFGIGVGLVNAPITNSAVSGMPPGRAGVAAGVASTSRQFGMSLGVAVTGAIIAARLAGNAARGLTDASRPVWLILVGEGVAIGLIGLMLWTRAGSSRHVHA